MSGRCDTVMVIAVPGGPDDGDIVTSGLPSVVRSVVAHTELQSGIKLKVVSANRIDLLKHQKIKQIANKI